MNLFELFVKIDADTSKAEKGMKDTQKNSETLTNKIKVMSAQFEAAQKNVDKLTQEFNESVNKTGAASKETQELAKKLDDAEKEAKKAKEALDGYNKELEDTGKTASKTGAELSSFAEKLGNGLKNATKIGVTAIASLGTTAIKNFADFEQLAGGAELMFGDAFDTVMENAKNAYKTVQMSQNEYLQQVNGFATGLKTALGGNEKAAADLAHRIVQAEADIVAATGNTAENVQNAFNGIMKSNFTMLDNLQIGITPTKEGFQEVIDKVNEWNASMGNATDYQMGNLADMQSALVDYIDMVGMSEYAQEEASGTILGSFASMKAAASDFATSLIDENGDVGTSWDNLKETVGTFVDNLKPKIGEFLEAISPIATTVAGITGAFVAFKTAATISTLISTLVTSFQAYQKANEGATIAQWLMNAAMNANPIVLIVTLIGGLIAAIVTLWNTNEDFRNAIISAWEVIKETATSVFTAVASFFTETIPNAFQSMVDWIREGISSFISIGSEILTGIYNGIVGSVQSLYEAAKTIILTLAENIIGAENLEKIISVGGDLIDSLIEGVENVIDTLTSVGEDVVESIKQGISDAWEGLKTWFNNLWDSLFKNRTVDVDVNASSSGPTNSNANGISYVPYDGYYSVLHKGERVLTAEENKSYNSDATGNTSGITIIQNIQTVPQTPVEFAAATEAYFEQARWAFA